MKNVLYFFLTFIFINTTFLLNINSQEVIDVKGVVGKGIIAGKVSETDARQDAINHAKVGALRKAGVKENLKQYETLFRSEVNLEFSEFFNSEIQAELNGAVQHYEIVKEEKKIDSDSKLFTIEVTINATVIIYSSQPDPTFNVKVTGIKGVYEEGENLHFTVYSTKKCYLHIFNITDKISSVFFPNEHERALIEIQAEKIITFPMGLIDYSLFASGKKPEMNRVVFVFTKEPITFLKYTVNKDKERVTTPESIFSWIYSITPDIRMVEYLTFTIR